MDLKADSSYREHQEESGLISQACLLFLLVVTILSILGFISSAAVEDKENINRIAQIVMETP